MGDFEQSLIARRLTGFHTLAETCLEFEPTSFNQTAGLICWYNTQLHYYLRVTQHETLGKVLGIVLTDDGVYDELTDTEIPIGHWDRCYLRAEIDHEQLQFSGSPDGVSWQKIGPVLDASKLSDDYGVNVLNFTGAFVGLCAQDMSGAKAIADFDYFELRTV